MKSAFDRIAERVEPKHKQFVKKALDISEQIVLALKRHPTINTQRKLAKELGKKESEISKLLSGLHNMTLESLTNIEAVLGVDLILTDEKAKEKYAVENKFTVYTSRLEKETHNRCERLKELSMKLSTIHTRESRQWVLKKDFISGGVAFWGETGTSKETEMENWMSTKENASY